MFSLFKAKPIVNPPILANLDDTLYPVVWPRRIINTPQDMLLSALDLLTDESTIDPRLVSSTEAQAFSQHLQRNPIYQDWINFTLYGRYIQRSFSAFYQQSEDSFNTQMPELLRYELQRHAQRLPKGQTLFFGGPMPVTVRQDRFFITTISPYQAIDKALQANKETISANQKQLIINEVDITDEQVLGFAVKHNKRTSERGYHEVMILSFTQLRQVKEVSLPMPVSKSTIDSIVIRYYELS